MGEVMCSALVLLSLAPKNPLDGYHSPPLLVLLSALLQNPKPAVPQSIRWTKATVNPVYGVLV
jgi:hypothetical protein